MEAACRCLALEPENAKGIEARKAAAALVGAALDAR
jgi:hypothetical protein